MRLPWMRRRDFEFMHCESHGHQPSPWIDHGGFWTRRCQCGHLSEGTNRPERVIGETIQSGGNSFTYTVS